MTNNTEQTVAAPLFKIATAWFAAIGIASWSELAAMLAAFYSMLLILEWWWKKFWRPMLERHGVLQRQRRRKEDSYG